jgi:carboxyl-terminal processing protease
LLERAAIGGMARIFDDTADYQRPEDVHRHQSNGGVLITLDGSDGAPLVIGVFADGPAARAGVLPGDRVIAIDGASVQGLRLYEVIVRLKGPVGSSVSLTVDRNGEQRTFAMERATAHREAVTWRIVDGIGVITVESFPENAGRKVRDAIRDIQRELREPAGYILDLRDNSGGLLDQVIEVADYFLDGGPVLVVRPFGQCRDDEAETYNARRRDESEGARLIVLTNANTASGAEVVAATLRERRGATLVGQTSYGQGSVHTVIPMNGGRDGFLKLRTGTLTTPSGVAWAGAGLTPDVATELRDAVTDPAMTQAIALLWGPAPSP